jgi:hypothetical protein
MKNEMIPVATPLLRLPLQVSPIERTLAAAALTGESGVVPSQNWGQIFGQVAQTALPILASLF